MYYINKITSNSVVDYAAEEMRKYLRMMMPNGGDVRIAYTPEAEGGFRLGLMQDFGLDVSDVKDVELDDIIYIDTDEKGGIIAGDNPRSVLLAVYEYFRQNGYTVVPISQLLLTGEYYMDHTGKQCRAENSD